MTNFFFSVSEKLQEAMEKVDLQIYTGDEHQPEISSRLLKGAFNFTLQYKMAPDWHKFGPDSFGQGSKFLSMIYFNVVKPDVRVSESVDKNGENYFQVDLVIKGQAMKWPHLTSINDLKVEPRFVLSMEIA